MDWAQWAPIVALAIGMAGVLLILLEMVAHERRRNRTKPD